MPCWYFTAVELNKTPSQLDGIDDFTELRYRREGVKLIVDAGSALGLYPLPHRSRENCERFLAAELGIFPCICFISYTLLNCPYNLSVHVYFHHSVILINIDTSDCITYCHHSNFFFPYH